MILGISFTKWMILGISLTTSMILEISLTIRMILGISSMKLRYRYIRTERCCSHDNNIIFIKIYICIKQHQLCIVLNGISNKYHWKHIINLANIQCFNSNNLGLFHWYGMLSTHTIT